MDYYPPLSLRQPVPPGSLPSLIFLPVIVLSQPPSLKISFAVLILNVAALARAPFYTAGGMDYANGVTAARIQHDNTKSITSDWDAKSTVARIWWATQLAFSPREIGFCTQAKNVPPAPPKDTSVLKFSSKQLLRFLWYFLLFDICDKLIFKEGQAGVSSILSQSLPRQLYLVWLGGFRTYFRFLCQFAGVACLSTILRISKPHDWPPLFGQWAEAWSVRQFWGRTWHQMLRNCITCPSDLIANYAGLRPGTWPSTYTRLFLCFFFSGACHALGGLFAARRQSGDFQYFLLQAVAITAEDIILWFAKSRGWRGGIWGRVLGRVWLFLWMSWCLRGWFEGRVSVGEWRIRQAGSSIVDKFWN